MFSYRDVPCPLPQLFLQVGGIVNVGEFGKAPGVGAVVNGDLIALVENNIPRLCGDLLVVTGQCCAQCTYLFKSAVVLHLHADGSLGEQLLEFLGSAVFRKGGRPFIFANGDLQDGFLLLNLWSFHRALFYRRLGRLLVFRLHVVGLFRGRGRLRLLHLGCAACQTQCK